MNSPRAFVYTEVQLSVPFGAAPWREVNIAIRRQPGFRSKTWLSGDKNHSLGGFYEFDSLENARRFAYEYFPQAARELGTAFTTRIFNGDITAEASRAMNSPHYR
jgi:hypothetical protein